MNHPTTKQEQRTRSHLALVLVLLSPMLAAQVINDPAPPGNVQALHLAGGSGVGDGLLIRVTAAPGALASLVLASAPFDSVTPFGRLLIDPATVIGYTLNEVVGPEGMITHTRTSLPPFPVGTAFYLQVVISTGGTVQLSNRSQIHITAPIPLTLSLPSIDPIPSPTNQTSVTVTGRAANPGSTMTIQGASVPVNVVANGGAMGIEFSAPITLLPNRINELYFLETTSGGLALPGISVSVIHDAQGPELIIDLPSNNAELSEGTVTVLGRVGDVLSGFMGLTVSVNGITANVDPGIGTNGTFEAPGVAINPVGTPTTIQATASDMLGNMTTRTILVEQIALTGNTMVRESGNNQVGTVGQSLTNPIVVRVRKPDSTPFVNKLVLFEVIRSDGKLSTSQLGPATTIQLRTDSGGLAAVNWTLGNDAGCGNNRVRVTSEGINGEVLFCASAQAGTPSRINLGSGGNQIACVGGPAPQLLRAWVNDGCNGVNGVPVTFSIESGEAGLMAPDALVPIPTNNLIALSGLSGHAEARLIVGNDAGVVVVTADFAGNQTSPVRFAVRVVEPIPALPTTYEGIVLSNARAPIGGADCTLEIGGQNFSAVSAADGRFVITGITSVGQGHLRVDGFPATLLGGSTISQGRFPFLEYLVTVFANVANAHNMPILLPPLNPSNQRIYDGVNDIELTVAGVAGLKFLVKAGSMRLANGLPAPVGTVLSLNQVHHDDVPMPMPDGVASPYAGTLQPAGATFDPPIEITYPNIAGLAPYAVTNFMSFDHDTGRFEIVCSGVVSEDGSVIHSEPGDGLHIAGWHCNCPPYSVTGECKQCVTRCMNGSITAGSTETIPPDPVMGQPFTIQLVGYMDSGGAQITVCPDGTTTTPIPPAPVGVSYEVFFPSHTAAAPNVATGIGDTINIGVAECGTYKVRWTLNASRPCPPDQETARAFITVSDPSSPPCTSVSVTLFDVSGNPLNALIGGFIAGGVQMSGSVDASVESCLTCCPSAPPAITTEVSLGGSIAVTGALSYPIPGLSMPLWSFGGFTFGGWGFQIVVSATGELSAGASLVRDPCPTPAEWGGQGSISASGTLAGGICFGNAAACVPNVPGTPSNTLSVSVTAEVGLFAEATIRPDSFCPGLGLMYEGEWGHSGLTGTVSVEFDGPFGLSYSWSFEYTFIEGRTSAFQGCLPL